MLINSKYIKNPFKIIRALGTKGYLKWMSDESYLKLTYWSEIGLKLNLKKPKTFSEKIQWLKLYDRNHDYSKYVDKSKVREYTKKTVGEKYLIPLIGTYDTLEEVNWNTLPNKFVLKCTHGSGSNIVCNNKDKLDVEHAKSLINSWMDKSWFWLGREYPYKNIQPKIIIEEYLQDNITDYKVYCFNGKAMYFQVIKNRGSGETIDFFDTQWNHMGFTGLKRLPHSNEVIPKPEKLTEMLRVSEKLANPFYFVRVDFYYVKGRVYFGELTLYPASGFGTFSPPEWNEKIGKLLQLPSGDVLE